MAALIALVSFGSGSYSFAGSAGADVVGVKGSAFGYFTNVSLFGGPSSTHGPAPTVTLPAGGSATPIVSRLPDGAKGQYGPAVVFGGIWPDEAPTGGPSGPITVSTQGTMGPDGSVTSSVDIVMHNPPRPLAPGGIGPGPLIAQEAHSTCTARESGVSGSATFINGIVETKYDTETQLPVQSAIRPIPVNPPINQEYTGTIDHVGDHFKIVLNEQIRNADGSLTVNAAHMFLLGPIAVGEMIVGQSVCGVTGGPSSAPSPSPGGQSPNPAPNNPSPAAPSGGSQTPTTAAGSPTTTAVPSPDSTVAGDSTTSTSPALAGGVPTTARSGTPGSELAARPVGDSGGGGLPVLPLIIAVATAAAAAVVWFRRRGAATSGQPPGGMS